MPGVCGRLSGEGYAGYEPAYGSAKAPRNSGLEHGRRDCHPLLRPSRLCQVCRPLEYRPAEAGLSPARARCERTAAPYARRAVIEDLTAGVSFANCQLPTASTSVALAVAGPSFRFRRPAEAGRASGVALRPSVEAVGNIHAWRKPPARGAARALRFRGSCWRVAAECYSPACTGCEPPW